MKNDYEASIALRPGMELPQLCIQDMVLSQWIFAYMKHYSLDIETLIDVLDARSFLIIVTGQFNPKAYWNRPLEEVAAKRDSAIPGSSFARPSIILLLYWPIRLWDGRGAVMGAGAVILCAAEMSKQFQKEPIHYLGTGNAHGTSMNEKMYTHPFVAEASRQAYEMATFIPKMWTLLRSAICMR